MGQKLLWTHYCDWQHGVRGRGLGEQISSSDNDLKTWGLIMLSSQSERSIELTWPGLTNQRPRRIILLNAPVLRPLTRLLLLWGETKLICHNRSIRAIKRRLAKTLDYHSCFIAAAQFQISRMSRTGNERGGMGLLFYDYFCFNYCSPVIIWRWLYLYYLVVTKTPASSWISDQIKAPINPWIRHPPLSGRPPKWICLLSITPGWDSYLYWEPPPCCVMNLKHSFNIFT